MKKDNKKLIELAKEAYPALRKLIIYALVFGIGIVSTFEDGQVKIGIVTSLAVALLFFLFDIHSAVTKQLDSIESKIPDLEAKPYPKFSFIENDLNKILDEKIKNRKEIHVEIIAVSASCTWPYFQENIYRFLKQTDGKYNIKLDIIISSDETLTHWNAFEWLELKHAQMTQYKIFSENHKEELKERNIQITI